MKFVSPFVVFLVLLSAASLASADCVYQGRSYPKGTNIGGAVCQDNGQWR